jgi:hypothetical protein
MRVALAPEMSSVLKYFKQEMVSNLIAVLQMFRDWTSILWIFLWQSVLYKKGTVSDYTILWKLEKIA